MQVNVSAVSGLEGRHKFLQHIPINLKLGHQQDIVKNAVSVLRNTMMQILTRPFSNHMTLVDFFKYELATVIAILTGLLKIIK